MRSARVELIPAETVEWHPLSGVPAPDYVPEVWDGPHCGKRLIEAFSTLAKLPLSWGPVAFGTAWPSYLHEWVDVLYQQGADLDAKERAREARNRVRLRPSAQEITRMEEAISWPGRYLAQLDQGQVLTRTVQQVARWRSVERETEWIAHKLRVSPTTLRRRNRAGLDAISLGLRRDRLPVF